MDRKRNVKGLMGMLGSVFSNELDFNSQAYFLLERLRDELDGITVGMCLTREDRKWGNWRVEWISALRLKVSVTDHRETDWEIMEIQIVKGIDVPPRIITNTKGRKTYQTKMWFFKDYDKALEYIKKEIGYYE